MGLFIYLDDEENTVIETPLMRFYVLRHPVYVYVYATSDANRAQSAPPCLFDSVGFRVAQIVHFYYLYSVCTNCAPARCIRRCGNIGILYVTTDEDEREDDEKKKR